MKTFKRIIGLVILFIFAFQLGGLCEVKASEKRNIVLLIDNSTSMKETDSI